MAAVAKKFERNGLTQIEVDNHVAELSFGLLGTTSIGSTVASEGISSMTASSEPQAAFEALNAPYLRLAGPRKHILKQNQSILS